MSSNNSNAIATKEQGLMSVMDDEQSQFLTFILGDEVYGVDILQVQEIRGWQSVTPIPNSPKHIRGVLNLRGGIVPILDLRRRFNMEEIEFTAHTVVIVVNILGRTIGMVVDGVSDVVDFDSGTLKPAPDFGASIDAGFISGLAPIGETMVIVLNVDEILKTSDLISIDKLTEEVMGEK